MHRFASIAWLALAALAFAQPGGAQQLRQAQSPTSLSGPQLRQPATLPPPPMPLPSDPSQRPSTVLPIPTQGPAQDRPGLPGPVSPLQDPDPNRPAQVVNRLGLPVRGALQVGPNRIFDPATGRYHWTRPLPAGGQQKIEP